MTTDTRTGEADRSKEDPAIEIKASVEPTYSDHKEEVLLDYECYLVCKLTWICLNGTSYELLEARLED